MTQNEINEAPQYFLAEHLNPEWLEFQHAELEKQLSEASGGAVYNIQGRLASNKLEMGINQRSREFADAAFDDFDALARHPDSDLRHLSWYKARLFLATSSTFYHRVERQPLTQAAMNEALTNSMNFLEEIAKVKEHNNKKFLAMADLITYGALARLQQPEYFPYFSTFREFDKEPSHAGHEEYVLGVPAAHYEPYKDPISLRPRLENSHNLAIGTLFHDMAQEHAPWFREMGGGFVGNSVKLKRFNILSRLLIAESRNDSTMVEDDYVVLQSLSTKFQEVVSKTA